jgi:hypothetical protein
MTVTLSPAMSVVVKRSALERAGIAPETIADVASSDAALVVLGPLFDSHDVTTRLAALGLAFHDDYFDIAHSGGTVPEWCTTKLEHVPAPPRAAPPTTHLTSIARRDASTYAVTLQTSGERELTFLFTVDGDDIEVLHCGDAFTRYMQMNCGPATPLMHAVLAFHQAQRARLP